MKGAMRPFFFGEVMIIYDNIALVSGPAIPTTSKIIEVT
jgi:hypothetical protein